MHDKYYFRKAGSNDSAFFVSYNQQFIGISETGSTKIVPQLELFSQVNALIDNQVTLFNLLLKQSGVAYLP